MYDTIEERKNLLLENIGKSRCRDSSELTLKIEGKGTNLRIWVGEIDGKNLVYMRLDCYKNYSVPWSIEKFNYLEKPPKAMNKLLKFGFTSDISHLDEILEITKKMKYRQLMSW